MPADPGSHGSHAARPDEVPPAGNAPTRESAAGRVPQRLAQAALKDLPWEVGVAKPDPAIVVDKVTRTFGGLTAVSVDHLEIQRGGITGLIGPNGAGKTTLFNRRTGFDPPNTATWAFDGPGPGRLKPHHAAPRGGA